MIHYYPTKFQFNIINPQISKGGQMDPPIGFSDLKFEAFKQSKRNTYNLCVINYAN